MMTEFRRTAWLLALILAVPGLALAARQGRLVGKVVDPEGNPIPGATVTASSPDIADFEKVMTTNEKGVFKIDFKRLFVTYHYRFEKFGYQTALAQQAWDLPGTRRHEFVMHPGEATTVEGRPPASTSRPAIVAFNDGVRAYEAEDYPTAQAKLEEALGHDPELRLAWDVLTLTHMEQQDHEAAAAAAEKAIALGSRDQSVLRSRWEAYRELGDEAKTAEAQEDLERIGRLAEEAKGIYNEGVALTKAGDDDGAFRKFQEALELDPSLQVAQLGLATAALEIDRPAEAAAAAETLLNEDPGNEQGLRLRYNAALQLKDEAKVVDALVGLAAVDPDLAIDGLLKLARAAYESDDTVNAKTRFSRILELDASYPEPHYFLGLILMREGANEEARSHLERFLQLAPDDPDAATAEGALGYLKES